MDFFSWEIFSDLINAANSKVRAGPSDPKADQVGITIPDSSLFCDNQISL